MFEEITEIWLRFQSLYVSVEMNSHNALHGSCQGSYRFICSWDEHTQDKSAQERPVNHAHDCKRALLLDTGYRKEIEYMYMVLLCC